MADVKAVRDPLEQSFFDSQAEVERKALALYEESPEAGEKYLTEHAHQCMEQVVDLYRQLRNELITKYTNNLEWL